MTASLTTLLSLSVVDLPVALALGALVLSFGISVAGLTQMALKRKGNSHE